MKILMILMLIGIVAVSAKPGSTNTNTVVRMGYLPEELLQHPINPDAITGGWTQGYLDVIESGRRAGQIILLFRKGGTGPDQTGRLIQVTGISEQIDLGGAAGTKNKCANELIRVQSWKYIGTANTPHQAAQSTARTLAEPGR